jgi:dynein assembly factor 3, axonemal
MDDTKVWDAKLLWDYRSRGLLGRRFDSKENVYDWDFNMKLMQIPQAGIIHPLEYKKFRNTGSPFELRDAKMQASNKTMATVDYLVQVRIF